MSFETKFEQQLRLIRSASFRAVKQWSKFHLLCLKPQAQIKFITIMRLVWIIIFKKPEAANEALFWIIKVETEGVLVSMLAATCH